ncbi:MAG TPA: serine/threonine-protein kinase [Ktedonobacterales bacterium]|nr:serine/threonine-protein kinase [Ktedonobacterales bacterium]
MAETSNIALPIGTVVHQRYRITAIVGRGGLGTVYQVADVLYGRQNVYALKELIDQSQGARKQFELESQWLQSLDHNHIPKVREHFEWEQRLYLVMDYVDGENLEEKLAHAGGRPLPEQQVLTWILPVCDALHYLHTRMPPILHRDVKPANIIVTPGQHAVLVDLGIAKEHLPGAGQTATFVRKAGTEGYAPPEQYTVAGQTGPWSDVYGVGATLYQLLTGGVPPTAVERVALDKRLIPPRELNPGVSPHVSAAVLRALALRPVERFQSVRELAQALVNPAAAGYLGGTRASATPPLTPAPPSLPNQRATGQMPSPPGNARTPAAALRGPMTPADQPRSFPQPITGVGDGWGASIASARHAEARMAAGTGSGGLAPAGQQLRAAQARLADEGEERIRRRGPLRSPLVLGIAGACVAALLIGLTVAVLAATAPPDRSSPQAAVSGYFTALSARDYDRAWQYATASRNAPDAHDSFVGALRADDARFGHVRSATITHVDNSAASKVTVQVDVRRGDGSAATFTYILTLTQYDGNTWLIDNAATS